MKINLKGYFCCLLLIQLAFSSTYIKKYVSHFNKSKSLIQQKNQQKTQQKNKNQNKQKKKSENRKHSNHHKQVPRATELSNVYGANPYNNIYGPRPHLINRDALIKNPDGSVVRKRIRLIENSYNNNNNNNCDITQKEHFYFCLNISDCDICSSSPFCGWCEQAQQCLPGHLQDTSCPGECVNGWQFSSQSCSGKVKSGSLSNIDPLNTEQISPVEYSYPKYRIDSVITTPEVVTTPVLLGHTTEHHLQQHRNVENNQVVKSQDVIVNKPIYGEIRQVMPVNTHMLQYVDAATGKRLDGFNGNTNIGYHGTEGYQVQGEVNNDYVPSHRHINRK